MAKVIMIQGTMSNAGKSLLVAGLCRIFKQDGYRVAPFKSQNMALNSYITDEGLEMGRAQVVQAEAAGMKPTVLMNPILLKPTNDTGSQVIVNGEVLGNMNARDYFAYKTKLIPDILKAFHKLEEQADIIVIEGAGSPAEINLKENDIVNMGMAEMVDAPVLLVGDIDRGGVFAQLLGTIMLLEEKEKDRIKGLIINKFRGDKTILDPGIAMLEEKGGIPVTGVVPYMQLHIEDEDSLTERFDRKEKALIDLAVIRYPRISNFTDFDVFEQMEDVSVRYVTHPAQLEKPDAVFLPGSKNTMGDLKWLRESGMEAAIKKLAETTVIFGICGGYQMLGMEIADPDNVEEGGVMRGIELLPVKTVLQPAKTRTQTGGVVQGNAGILSGLAEKHCTGYEIHMGDTKYVGEGVYQPLVVKDGKYAVNEDEIAKDSKRGSSILETDLPDQIGSRIGSVLENTADMRADCQKDVCSTEEWNNQVGGFMKIPVEDSGNVDGCVKENVYGTYLHGFFDEGDLAVIFVKALADKKGVSIDADTKLNYAQFKETQYDLLADTLREYLDMDAVYGMLREAKTKRHQDF